MEQISLLRPQKEPTLLTPLFLDFWPPELGENTFLLLQATKFAIVRYSSSQKLIQHPLRKVV